jgi:Methyltransferase domain
LRRRRPREAGPLDPWLELFDERLGRIDAACVGAGPEGFALFGDLDDDLWTLLLSREYEHYPGILSLLPELPDPGRQIMWTGAAGLETLGRAKALYCRIRDGFERHHGPLDGAAVLDFGCGWGRLTRFFARDVDTRALCGCDPVPEILDVCRETRVPAELEVSDPVPERLPFERSFDLVFRIVRIHPPLRARAPRLPVRHPRRARHGRASRYDDPLARLPA